MEGVNEWRLCKSLGYVVGWLWSWLWETVNDEAFLKDQSFSSHVLNCKEELSSKKLEENTEVHAWKIRFYSEDLDPPIWFSRTQKRKILARIKIQHSSSKNKLHYDS